MTALADPPDVPAILAALSADAEDESIYDLLSVTFDEDEGEVIGVAGQK